MFMMLGVSKHLVSAFPGFYKQVDILVLFILSNNLKTNSLTPQEVGDWFGCEEKKKEIYF